MLERHITPDARRARARAADRDDGPLRRRDRARCAPARRSPREAAWTSSAAATALPPAGVDGAARDPRAAGDRPDRLDDGARARRRPSTVTWPTRSSRSSCRRVRAARRIADLGAGAGWPGLALAAALPDARVALVESAVRHCRYLERAVAAGGLANVEVVHARAEEWPAGSAPTTSSPRARSPRCPCCASTPRRCCADGGVLVAWKGAVEPAEAAAGAGRGGACSGSSRSEVRAVEPYPGRRAPHAPRLPQGRARRRSDSRAARGWRTKRP